MELLMAQHGVLRAAAADLACGTGVHARLLAPCFDAVLALDVSVPMLRVCAQECADLDNVATCLGTLQEFELPRRVDVAICLGDSLNYLLSEQDLARFFRRAHATLSRRGLL
jgi:predicted TPR repeat methyltransferase